jgi:hypothetical protein
MGRPLLSPLVRWALAIAAPAVVASRPDPIGAMRGGGRSTTERGSRVRRGLVALQVAVSLVLITCAGLLGRSLQKLESQDFGVAIAGRYVVNLSPSLACLGLYGVTAYTVATRTREIGIRMAIGASRPRVLRTLLTGALWQLAMGVAIGVPAALVAARLLESQLFGVTSRDPLVLGSAIALLVATALAAAAVPSARAATMDPVRALRVD